MKNHWSPALLAALISLPLACGGDDGSATSADSSTTSNDPTSSGGMTTTASTSEPTTGGPTTSGPTTEGTATEGATTGGSAEDDTTSASDGAASSSTSDGDDSGTTTEGGPSSSSEGSSSGGVSPNCAAGDGPDFTVTNNGFTDYVIDGVNDPDLTVVRGCSYTFTINAVGHPFLIKTVQGIGLLNTYDDGVVNQGAQNGVLSWDVAEGAPDTLFYDCQFHGTMTGTITVIDG